MKMETQAFSLAALRFLPVAIGLFGLATGYFILGWAVPVWFSKNQRRSEQNDGNVGPLDAGVQANPHWSFSPGWTDLVQPFPKCGSFYIWLVSPSRLTAFTGSRWPTGDTSIPALGLTVGWRSRSYS